MNVLTMMPDDEQRTREMILDWKRRNGLSIEESFGLLLLEVGRHARILVLMDEAGATEYNGQSRDDIESTVLTLSYVLGRRPDGDPETVQAMVQDALAWRATEFNRMPYGEYLASPEWQDVRHFARQRAGDRCQVCNAAGRLDVHHRTYVNRGCESLDDVTVLCRACHQTFHDHRSMSR